MAYKISKWLVIGALILFGIPVASYEEPVEPPLAQVPEHLKPVCNCESLGDPDVDGRQFNDDGSVIVGPGGNYGICQINKFAHDKRAKALGIDYMTREGNIAFAELLYSERGYKPWYKWSGHCFKDDPRINQDRLQEAQEALRLAL